jgi:hypothetical protein
MVARRLECSIYLRVSGWVTHYSKDTEATDHRSVTPIKSMRAQAPLHRRPTTQRQKTRRPYLFREFCIAAPAAGRCKGNWNNDSIRSGIATQTTTQQWQEWTTLGVSVTDTTTSKHTAQIVALDQVFDPGNIEKPCTALTVSGRIRTEVDEVEMPGVK